MIVYTFFSSFFFSPKNTSSRVRIYDKESSEMGIHDCLLSYISVYRNYMYMCVHFSNNVFLSYLRIFFFRREGRGLVYMYIGKNENSVYFVRSTTRNTPIRSPSDRTTLLP